MADRERFSLPTDGFSASEPSTIELGEVDNFLDSDPDEIVQIDPEEERRKLELEKKKQSQQKTPLEKKKDLGQEELKEETPSGDKLISGFLENEKEEGDPEEQTEELNETGDNIAVDKNEKQESIYSSLSKSLKQLGVFTPDEDEDGNEIPYEISSDKDFLSRWETESNRKTSDILNNFLDRFGPDYREMFDAVYVNGVTPYEYLSRQSKIESIEKLDISTEENQEKIVRELYRAENKSAEYIESRIGKLKNYGDLEEEAKEAKTVLATREQQALEQTAQSKRQEVAKRAQIKNQYISGVNKIITDKLKTKEFDGIPVDRKFADQTIAYLTQDKYETPDKQLLTEFDKDVLDLNRPENHETKVKVAMIMQILKSDPTLSKIQKKAISKESDSLFSDIEKRFGGKSKKEPKQDSLPLQNADW